MKKTDLRTKTLKTLRELALSLGVKNPSTSRKDDLIAEIQAAERIRSQKRRSKVMATPPALNRQNVRKDSTQKTKTATAAKQASIIPPPPASKQSKEKPSTRPQHIGLSPERVAEAAPTPVQIQPSPGRSPYDNLGELPESYGTGRLFFAARDPHWIYAYWDYTWQQMEDIRRIARHGELKLRVYNSSHPQEGSIHQEITLNPAARNWFVHAGNANADYCAELGYYDHSGKFIATTRSRTTHTPPDRPSSRTDARFVTIPFHISFGELFNLVKGHFRDGEELADVLHRLQAAGFRFPFDYHGAGALTSAQEQELSRMFDPDLLRRIFMGSQVLAEWLKRRLSEETSSGLFSPSSPFGASFGAVSARGFWFNVNAELIIYGATEPKATVVFDDRPISLKPDGTFRFQFALPDGDFRLPISATSPDGVETRSVNLHFVRETATQGGVGVVPHPPELAAPNAKKA
ncbi:MAG: DUF4912 domain-containing protein [Verrucomicrobiae bacterium]|nr:DUF4912 domain-containing protein [Verrucomicrobiae bacterium]